MERLLLSPTEAAEALGIGTWKLYELLRRGEIPSIRIGSCRRIATAELSAYIARLHAQDGPTGRWTA